MPDDIRGFKECYLILKSNGALIFTVPLYDISTTIQRAAIKNGKVHHYLEPEYHSSRIEGPNSVLTFWRHSINDIVDRVESAGFHASLVDVQICKSQIEPQKVIYAIKPL